MGKVKSKGKINSVSQELFEVLKNLMLCQIIILQFSNVAKYFDLALVKLYYNKGRGSTESELFKSTSKSKSVE